MPIVETITNIISKVRGWLDQNPILSKTIMALAAAAAALLIPLGTMILFLPQLIALHGVLTSGKIAATAATIAHTVATTAATIATTAFGIALNIALGPIGLVILAIGALVAAGIALWKNWDKVSSAIKTIWEGLKTAAGYIFKGMLTYILAPWKGFLELLKKVIEGVKRIPVIGSRIPGIGIAGDVVSAALVKISEITYMQHGGMGIVTKPTLFMAGEAGREAFAFSPAGMAGLGGMGRPVTVNVNAGVFMGSESEAETFGYWIRDKVAEIDRRDGL